MNKVLLIDDAEDIHFIVKQVLDLDTDFHGCHSLAEARHCVMTYKPDLILLDIDFGDGNGFNFYEEVRRIEGFQNVPIIFLTGHSNINDRIRGLTLGADDYVVKPFNPIELKARVKNRLMRWRQSKDNTASEILKVGNLEVDQTQHRICVTSGCHKKTQIDVTPTDYKLLVFMLKHPNHLLSRDQLIDAVWGAGTHITARTIDTHIKQLRSTLPVGTAIIETVHGKGYKLKITTI